MMIRNPEFVISFVSKFYGCSRIDIVDNIHRNRFFSEARLLTSKLLREVLGMSYPSIGKLLNRDHSTIVKNLKLHRNNEAVNSLFLRFKTELNKHALEEEMLRRSINNDCNS